VFVEQTGIDQLLNNVTFAEGYEGALDRLIIELLYGTGMRRSELLNLKESDVDSYNSQIKVLGKGNKERLIPLHPQLVGSIKKFIETKRSEIEVQEGSYLLVTTKGKKLSAPIVYNCVKKHLSLVTTIDKRSPHVMRHTFATHLLNNGADINAVKELLGHSSLAATQVYTHNTIEKLKAVYAKAHPKA
jgi:integrase/recombinase XerC